MSELIKVIEKEIAEIEKFKVDRKSNLHDRESQALRALKTAVEALESANEKLNAIDEMFTLQGLGVTGWHKNGDIEPIDKFFEENDWLAETEALATISRELGEG